MVDKGDAMLSGKRPFGTRAMSPLEVLLAVCNDEPEPLATHNAGVSPQLQRVVDRCLSKAPGGRYATAREFVSALDEAAKTLGPSAPEPAKATVAAGEPRQAAPDPTISLSSTAGTSSPAAASPQTPPPKPASSRRAAVILGVGGPALVLVLVFRVGGHGVASNDAAPVITPTTSPLSDSSTSGTNSTPDAVSVPPPEPSTSYDGSTPDAADSGRSGAVSTPARG